MSEEERKQKEAFIEEYVKNLEVDDAILPLDSRVSMVTNRTSEINRFRIMHILEELYPHRCSNEKCNEELFIYDGMNMVMALGLTFKDFIINWRSPHVKFYCSKCYNNQKNNMEKENNIKTDIKRLENEPKEIEKKRFLHKTILTEEGIITLEEYFKTAKGAMYKEAFYEREIWELEKERDHLVLLVKELRKHLNLRYKLKRMKLRIKNERGKMKCQKKN